MQRVELRLDRGGVEGLLALGDRHELSDQARALLHDRLPVGRNPFAPTFTIFGQLFLE